MLILLIFLGTILVVASYEILSDCEEIVACICGLTALLSIAILIILLVIFPYNIDKKITMYEEENEKIEEKVKNSILAYQEYEQEIYESFIKNADIETLLLKYPELKSNNLVMMEIDTYIENSKQIKKLKEQLIDRKTYGWWICFNIGIK